MSSGTFIYCLRAPLVIGFRLCVPPFLGFAYHSYYFVIFVGFHYYYFAVFTLLLFFPLSYSFFTYRLSTSSSLQLLFIYQLLLHFNLLNRLSFHLHSLPLISHLYLRSTFRLW